MPSESAHDRREKLTLAHLASYDDIITDVLIDRVYFWSEIRKNKTKYSHVRGLSDDQVPTILLHHVVVEKDVAKAEKALLALPPLQRFLTRLRTAREKEWFRRHLRKYINIYLPECPFEVTTTNRYAITNNEAAVGARRFIAEGETIRGLTGTLVAMTREEERQLDMTRRDFSIVMSSRRKLPSIFLGPARFANHDCNANCKLVMRSSGTMEVVAVRDIDIDEEITVTYGDNYFGEGNCECLCHTCEDALRNGWAPKAVPSLPLDNAQGQEGNRTTATLDPSTITSMRHKRRAEESDSALSPPSPKRRPSESRSAPLASPSPESDPVADGRAARGYSHPPTTTMQSTIANQTPTDQPLPRPVEFRTLTNPAYLSTPDASDAEKPPLTPRSQNRTAPVYPVAVSIETSISVAETQPRKSGPVSSGPKESSPAQHVTGTSSVKAEQGESMAVLDCRTQVAQLVLQPDDESGLSGAAEQSQGSSQRQQQESQEGLDDANEDEKHASLKDEPVSQDANVSNRAAPIVPSVSTRTLEAREAKPPEIIQSSMASTKTEEPPPASAYAPSLVSPSQQQQAQQQGEQQPVRKKRGRKPKGYLPPADTTTTTTPIATHRIPGDYIRTPKLLSQRYDRWNDCKTCRGWFVQSDAYQVRRECPRCERHSKLYGYRWPKTQRYGARDTEERIMDHRTVHRFLGKEDGVDVPGVGGGFRRHASLSRHNSMNGELPGAIGQDSGRRGTTVSSYEGCNDTVAATATQTSFGSATVSFLEERKQTFSQQDAIDEDANPLRRITRASRRAARERSFLHTWSA